MVEDDDDCSLDNPMMSMIHQPGIGEYLASGSPLRFDSGLNLEAEPAPQLGQHTEEILKQDLGLGDAEVGRLLADGIVAFSS